MAFGGNTRDLGSFEEETDEITDLHQILEEVLLTARRDDVAGITRRLRDPSSDGIRTSMDSFQGLTRKKSLIMALTFGSKSKFFYDHVNTVTRRTIDQSAGAHLALTKPNQVNKITTSCEIYSGPHDTQYCMEDPEQAFIEYASSRTNVARDARLSKFEADFKQQQSEITNKIDTLLKAIVDRIAGALPSDTVKNSKLSTSLILYARSYPTMDQQCSTHVHGSINAVTIHSEKQSDSYDEKAKENEEEEKDT
uniref:MAK10-like protein n=1 Tax=Tanacetum cinerariifolium TaxID=118510 RepID=A0A6L2NN46_TANCI|nr:MAK10-like protein [Tanacetum cinerariifolium]